MVFGFRPDPNDNFKDIPKKEEKIVKTYDRKSGRLFAVMTYASMDFICSVMKQRKETVKYWCAITHDKDVDEKGDLKITHNHLILETFNPSTIGTIRNWFFFATDENGESVTTLAQLVKFRKLAIDYLTHEHDPTKFHYSKENIVNLTDSVNFSAVEPRNDEDTVLNVIDDMLRGLSTFQLVRRYGRDFVIHYRNYKMILQDIEDDGDLPEYANKAVVWKKYRKEW